MDVTFWVIQVVLLAPVLFMAASANKPEESDEPRPDAAPAPDPPGGTQHPALVAQSPARVAAAATNLSQFSVEEQARLVLLRCLVQDARRRGALTEDSLAEDDATPAAPARSEPRATVPAARAATAARARGGWKASSQLVLASGALVLAAVGLAGVVRTSVAIDQLEQTSRSRTASVSPVTRLLPGMLADPAKYMSALNTSGPTTGPGSAFSDPLFDARFVDQKQAMDRWEAMIAVGLSLLLFVNATRAVPDRRPDGETASSSVAFDLAPFVLVAAVLFAGLSFFEIP